MYFLYNMPYLSLLCYLNFQTMINTLDSKNMSSSKTCDDTDLEYPNHGASMTQQSYFKRRTMTDYPCPNWLIALKHITATIY